MTKLAAWSMEARDGEGALQRPKPTRVDRSHIALERHLEDWIASDMTLIAEGLTLVGRQVTTDDWRLDLLAIDAQDRWVVIEIKPRTLDSGALAQALYYAASLDADELFGKLEARLGDFGDPEQLSASVKQQQEGEGERREIAVLLVGAGIHPGLERMNEFSRPLRRPDQRRQLRGIRAGRRPAVAGSRGGRRTGRAAAPPPADGRGDPPQGHGIRRGDAVRPLRPHGGGSPPCGATPTTIGENRSTGRPQTVPDVRATPAAATQAANCSSRSVRSSFVEFFDHLDEQEAVDALGEVNGVCGGGEALDAVLDRIERFLT